MEEYIIRISKNRRPFREIFIEAKNKEDAIQELDKEHRRFWEGANSNIDITSNLYKIEWIEGI